MSRHLNRPTSTVATAMFRMAEAFEPAITIRQVSGGWEIDLPYAGTEPTKKSGYNALAFCADAAMRLRGATADAIRTHVQWHGAVLRSGLAAWETAALRWLCLRDDLSADEKEG